jgi:hypothetical protein
MMNGGDLYELAKILGHSNIKMTSMVTFDLAGMRAQRFEPSVRPYRVKIVSSAAYSA